LAARPPLRRRSDAPPAVDPSGALVSGDTVAHSTGDAQRSGPTVRILVPGSCQLVEQRLRFLEIGRAETFREPVVDRGEELAGFDAPPLVAPQSGEARSGAQFPEFRLLLLGDAQGFAVQFRGGLSVPLPQQQLTFVPIKFRLQPAFSGPFN